MILSKSLCQTVKFFRTKQTWTRPTSSPTWAKSWCWLQNLHSPRNCSEAWLSKIRKLFLARTYLSTSSTFLQDISVLRLELSSCHGFWRDTFPSRPLKRSTVWDTIPLGRFPVWWNCLGVSLLRISMKTASDKLENYFPSLIITMDWLLMFW